MSEFHLPDQTHIAYAHFQVSDLQQSLAFYRDLMGFHEIHSATASAALSADGGSSPHIMLTEIPHARPKPARSTGLYHVAIRLPSRFALSRLFRRMVENGWPLAGFSDHGVSEALYLSDPDQNGLELYRDRPRNEWKFVKKQVEMVTKRGDINALLAETKSDMTPWAGIDPGTDIGHVHLHVSDLGRAEAFYVDMLGLDVMQRSYPGALFVAAGGYHHHVGLNIWAGQDAPPPPPDAVGLRAYGLHIPDQSAWRETVSRAKAANYTVENEQENGHGHSAIVRDLDGNTVELLTQL